MIYGRGSPLPRGRSVAYRHGVNGPMWYMDPGVVYLGEWSSWYVPLQNTKYCPNRADVNHLKIYTRFKKIAVCFSE